MSTKKTRLIVTLEPDMAAPLDRLKQEIFYAQPYSAMVREILAVGIKATLDALDKKPDTPTD